jgi:hypothetical protein
LSNLYERAVHPRLTLHGKILMSMNAPSDNEPESLRVSAQKVARHISDAYETAYFWNAIPDPLDLEISGFMSRFMASPDSERVEAAEVFSDRQALMLDAFATRMASWAVRRRSSAPIAWGLLALSLDCGKFDIRETLPDFIPLFDAALRIEVDSRTLFESVAALAEVYCRYFAAHLRRFHDLSLTARSLSAARMFESADGDGFRYETIRGSSP